MSARQAVCVIFILSIPPGGEPLGKTLDEDIRNLYIIRRINQPVLCWRSSMAEQLICNQQVAGSNPIASSRGGSRAAKGNRL